MGTGRIADQFKKYRSYEEAKKYAQSLNLKSQKDWLEHMKTKNFPNDIPIYPHQAASYKKKFEGYNLFLGNELLPHLRVYVSYNVAKKYALSLNLKNVKEWVYHTKSKDFPKDIPKAPDQFYINSGWLDWGNFLGTGIIAPRLRKYRSYEEAKKYAQSLNLKSTKDWLEHTKTKNFPKDIPAYPGQTYKEEFQGMGNFLGTGVIASYLRKYRSYEEAKKYAQSLNLKSQKDWLEHTKTKNFPNDIPAYPIQTYKKEFEGMKIFLGTNKKFRNKKK